MFRPGMEVGTHVRQRRLWWDRRHGLKEISRNQQLCKPNFQRIVVQVLKDHESMDLSDLACCFYSLRADAAPTIQHEQQ